MTTTPDPPRFIPPGSCSWCGHSPHREQACGSTIRTRVEEAAPCPCRRHLWGHR